MIPNKHLLIHYNQEDIDKLFSLHKRECCPDNCLFCQQEKEIFDSPLEVMIDQMKEIHYSTHYDMLDYPMINLCEYCRAEALVRKAKESRRNRNATQ